MHTTIQVKQVIISTCILFFTISEPMKQYKITVKPHVVIKPKARTFSRPSPSGLRGSNVLREEGGESGAKHCSTHHQACAASSECINNWSTDQWWKTMMHDKGDNLDNNQCLLAYQDEVGKLKFIILLVSFGSFSCLLIILPLYELG